MTPAGRLTALISAFERRPRPCGVSGAQARELRANTDMRALIGLLVRLESAIHPLAPAPTKDSLAALAEAALAQAVHRETEETARVRAAGPDA